MSRSCKKSPVHGVTSASSENEDKRLYNRRYRRAIKLVLHENPELEVQPHIYEYSDPWCMDKDGKVRFDPEKHPEWLRK